MCDDTLCRQCRDDYSYKKERCIGERGERGERGYKGEPGRDGCKGEKGCRGEPGRDGCKGERGEPGRDGCKGERGEPGSKGCRGETGRDGCKGEKGERGCKGEKGDPCKHTCVKCCVEFCDTQVCDTHKVYRVENKLNIVVYAFAEDCEVPLRICKGIEINSCAKQFVQLDLSDYNRVMNLQCSDPTLKLTGVQKYEKVIIYGSNELGCRGKELYCYTNQHDSSVCKEITIPSFDTVNLTRSGDLYLYGPNPFKYISIAACNGTIFLNNLTFHVYE